MKNKLKKTVWYRRKVLPGNKSGRTIGYPTVNLTPDNFRDILREGVYHVYVRYNNRIYSGALFFGPRLVKKETLPVLEIHILDFYKQIYGETLEFKINKFIRKNKDFKSMHELKKQIDEDIKIIRNIN